MEMGNEAAVARKRRETRRMKKKLRDDQEALRDKAMEREVLETKKQSMLDEEAAKKKMVSDFMLYVEAIEKKDTETVGKFDEKAMKNGILYMMMKGGGGHSGGFSAGDGGNEA